jgi:hypothetical protein
MTKKPRFHIPVHLPILSQPQMCSVAGMTMATANNLVARGIFGPDDAGQYRAKGTRKYSMARVYEGRIISEQLVHQKVGPSDAAEALKVAKLAALARKGGWVEHWARNLDAGRPFIRAFMVVSWVNDCWNAEVIGEDKFGWPDFSAVKDMRRRFFTHPFTVWPLTDLFIDVRQKCMAILMPDKTV